MVQDFLTPEQVLQYYCGNEEKAKAAMIQAEMDGRISDPKRCAFR